MEFYLIVRIDEIELSVQYTEWLGFDNPFKFAYGAFAAFNV
jgi:hypothetical protein